MPGCCADYCTNSDKKGYKMCRIPQCNKRRKIWIENIDRADWIAGPNATLCETHFSQEMWEINCKGQRKLKRTAVPTVFRQSATHVRVCDSHPVQCNMQNELEPVQFSASNGNNDVEKAEKELYKDIAQNCGESDAENHTENNDITRLVTELTDEHEEQQTTFESSIPEQKIIATNTESSRVAMLENRLAILERMFSRSERSRIDLKRKLDTARKIKARLEKRLRTVDSQEHVSKLFNTDQMQVLTAFYKKIPRWCNDTIEKSLKLRFACGVAGYEELLKQKFPLPCIRTLTKKKIEHLKFATGIWEEIFQFLEIKVPHFTNQIDKHCMLVMDEISIKPGNVYDIFTNI